MEKFKIPVSMLAPEIESDQLGFADTSELPALEEPLGQTRALEALDFGLQIKSPGFNIYVSGPIGTGKWSIVEPIVKRLAKSAPSPPDWCYVNNFLDQSSPRCLSFPASQGRGFQQSMNILINALRRDISAAFESTKYLEARAKILEERDSKKHALFQEVEKEAKNRGLGFVEEPHGFSLVTIRDGKPMNDEDIAKLSEEEQQILIEKRKSLESKMREFQSHIHALDHECEHRLADMDQLVVRAVMANRFMALRERYQYSSEALDYLKEVEEDIVTNYKDFLPRGGPTLPLFGLDKMDHRADLTRYQVNLLVEHSVDEGAPVIDETHPTYVNLIGRIERKSRLGAVYTDFTEIRSGTCLQASGGYLILNVMAVLRQPFAWDALKRVIKTRSVKIEDPGEFYGFSTVGLKPQPIPVDIKILLLGPPTIFQLLQMYEEDFQKIFKVKADFDSHTPRNHSQERLYGCFIGQLCRDEGLPHFGAGAVAEIIRQSLRLAERRDRLSLRISVIADLVREAAFWAKREGRTLVSQADVETSLAKRRNRANLPEQWIQDEIQEGTLIVNLEGELVGQINGLSVYQMGDYAFGRPCRITARTFVGNKGIIDIQREAELAGPIHSKGVMILSGFLAGKFAGAHPFALSTTLTFEQTYSEIEGDSAAVAELVAILSSLAKAPIRQNLAVTGSVNQLGEIQPIGGVNEKIEGFFESCKNHGFTGNQGVIIPTRNIKHLTLRREIIKAVEEGTFAVYGVDRIEEAIELLTGTTAGERSESGQYPEDTIFGRAAKRLEEMAQIVAAWGEEAAGAEQPGTTDVVTKEMKIPRTSKKERPESGQPPRRKTKNKEVK
jgi:lon-related putative ATP-dependent protease